MNYKIVKLDHRYAGNDNFDYRIEFPRGSWRFSNYSAMRDWLWENYGPSSERELYDLIYDRTLAMPKWAWHYNTKDNKPLLYVFDDATLAHLQLKWTT